MEIVEFTEPGSYDPDGYYVAGEVTSVAGCVVYPTGASTITDVDFDGDTSRLTVLAPAGTRVQVGGRAVIRGETYRVVHVPFDWAHGRRPAVAQHRPKLEIYVERNQANG